MKNSLTLVLFLFLLACSDKGNINHDVKTKVIDTIKVLKEENPYMTDYQNKEKMKKLLDNAIINGDTLSYQEAFKDYMISEHLQEFLYYSIKMAKIHNYGEAYFDIYYIMNLKDKRSGYLSQKDKNLSLSYLLKAYEMHNTTAKDKVKEMYIDKGLKIPNSVSVLGK